MGEGKKDSKFYGLLALTAIVSILVSVGTFTVMRDNFIGPQGEQGIQGSQGVQGEQGVQGIQGIQGEMGPAHEYEEVLQKYNDLLAIVNMTIVQNYSQTIEYNISAGTDETWEFLIPEYGIVWEARISFSGIYISMSHAYSMEGKRFFVGSSNLALDRRDIPTQYYPDQEHLWGTITVDYYQDDTDPNKIWVMGSIMTNLPTISRDANAYIDISLRETNFIQNGGLEGHQEEKTWLPPYWDGGGTLGGTGTGYIGRAEGLYSWIESKQSNPWCTEFWQDVQVDTSMLELTFWVSANPRGESITFAVFWGELQLMSQTWTGEATGWIEVSSTFPTEPGLYRLSFKILAVKDYTMDEMPFVVIDEISLTA